MSEKTVNINNFIGTYDGYVMKEECNKAINIYEDQHKFNNTLNRIASEKSPITVKQDQQYFATRDNIDVWWEAVKPMMLNFDLALQHYIQNTGILESYGIDKFCFPVTIPFKYIENTRARGSFSKPTLCSTCHR